MHSIVTTSTKTAGLKTVFGVFFLLVLAYALLFGKATFFLWKVLEESKKYPTASMTPTPMSLDGVAGGSGTRLTYFGYEFEVPWTDVDRNQTKSLDTLALIFFGTDKAITFHNPVKQLDAKTIFLGNGENRKAALLYGKETLRSNYALTKVILQTTPGQVSIFMPRARDVGAGVFLMLKPIYAVNGETGIFAFETPFIRGFQFGDPKKRPKSVTVKAFDQADREIEMTFAVKQGSSVFITQMEINRVLRTLRRATEPNGGEEGAAKSVGYGKSKHGRRRMIRGRAGSSAHRRG